MTHAEAAAIIRSRGVNCTGAKVSLLTILAKRGPMTAQQLVSATEGDYRALVGTLHRLEAAGLVVSSPEDLDVRTRPGATKPRRCWCIKEA